jgi:hypothetical protein
MSKVFGARAKVFMRYEGEMKELSKKLSKGLILPDFLIEFREEAPYDLTGSCEALGFELWLNKTSEMDKYDFVLEMETELSYDELSLDQMHNLSLWLARFISRICDLETSVMFENGDLIFFSTND